MSLDLRATLLRIQADVAAALALLPPDASTETLTTAAGLRAACTTGGVFHLADGVYGGNFRVDRPLTLIAGRGAELVPADPLLPTLTIAASDVTLQGFTVRGDREAVVVGDLHATRADAQPARVELLDLAVAAGPAGGHCAIALHGAALAVRRARVTGFWDASGDAKAIWINNGPGPYTVEDCYLEGSGETILVGGDHLPIPQCLPSDITIVGNTISKPDAWRTNGAVVKNCIELKVGRRVLVEGNTCDGNWRSGQSGIPIVLTVRNQYGDTPWALLDDVVVRGNRTRRCADAAALSVLGSDDLHPSQQTQRVTIEGNLFEDSPDGFLIINGVAAALVIRHNTLPAIAGALLRFSDLRPVKVVSPLVFDANVAPSGAYGVTGDGTAVGLPSLQTYARVDSFAGNVIEPTRERALTWPAGSTLLQGVTVRSLLDPATLTMRNGTAGWLG